jgi:hypothetical protein
MPDPEPIKTKPIAVMTMISALTLAAVAGLIYSRVIPLPEESRGLVAAVVAVAAAADFLISVWFFRKGQSS